MEDQVSERGTAASTGPDQEVVSHTCFWRCEFKPTVRADNFIRHANLAVMVMPSLDQTENPSGNVWVVETAFPSQRDSMLNLSGLTRRMRFNFLHSVINSTSVEPEGNSGVFVNGALMWRRTSR